MHKLITIFILMFVFYRGDAQYTIKGYVVNETGETPLPGANVFISNTMKGTTTNAKGYFELNNIQPGKYELIFSSVGFQTFSYSFSSEQLPLNLRVKMTIKEIELEEVVVGGYEKDGWQKWGRVFLENFIGSMPNASKCRITNYSTIKFRFFKKENKLKAYADEPLKIENDALGYKIHYQMEEFQVDYNDQSVFFAGYPYFSEMREDKTPKQKWIKNREKAYYGSVMHFIRSLYKDSLLQNGFEVKRWIRTPNEEKERVKNIYKDRAKHQKTMQIGTGKVIIGNNSTTGSPVDSSSYYESVMKQPDFFDKYGKDQLTRDSLLINDTSDFRQLFFTNYISVTYKNGLEDKEYILYKKEMRKPQFQWSGVFLTEGEPIQIFSNGSYQPPLDFFTLGYWAWFEKMANNLPFEYKPME